MSLLMPLMVYVAIGLEFTTASTSTSKVRIDSSTKLFSCILTSPWGCLWMSSYAFPKLNPFNLLFGIVDPSNPICYMYMLAFFYSTVFPVLEGF